jgi:phosphoglycerate dehydrogenase-like enzyme
VAPDAVPPPVAASNLVVLCDLAAAVPLIRERFPAVTVLDISAEFPDGTTGHVLYGGWGPRSEAAAAGVHWVQLIGTGLDGLGPEVRGANMLVSPRGASSVAISEYVIAALGAAARQFPQNWLRSAPDAWYFQPASILAGSTVGLFGFGGIAQRVARIALAMDMRVVALRRRSLPSEVPGVDMVRSFAELLVEADHLVLAAPNTDDTRQVLNAETLQLVRPGVHVVNIARGALIDQEALRVALDDGRISRASLDVTEPEPLPAGHWMYSHPAVFLTPHASWVGPPQFSRATDLFCENLERYLAGEPLVGVVGSDGY